MTDPINNNLFLSGGYSYGTRTLTFVCYSYGNLLLNSDIFRLCNSHPVFCALSAIRAGVFSKEFLLTLVFCLSFAIRTGVF